MTQSKIEFKINRQKTNKAKGDTSKMGKKAQSEDKRARRGKGWMEKKGHRRKKL